jgi:Universal stress protein family
MTADRAEERRPVALRDAAPRVLVAYDGSPQAERALVHAATLVRHGGTVRVVNVVPAQGVGARLQTVGDDDRGRQVGVLARARRLLAAHGVHAETIAAAGDPLPKSSRRRLTSVRTSSSPEGGSDRIACTAPSQSGSFAGRAATYSS